jgi:PIN domain nuclease of toxin-antitoxin system
MKVLVDTNTFIWDLEANPKSSRKAIEILRSANSTPLDRPWLTSATK